VLRCWRPALRQAQQRSGRHRERPRWVACRVHGARLRPDHREDHDVHQDHVRQDHVRQDRQDDRTEAHLRQVVCQAPPELPKAPVLQQGASQPAEMPQEALPLLAA
jgi:hypothetical protein